MKRRNRNLLLLLALGAIVWMHKEGQMRPS